MRTIRANGTGHQRPATVSTRQAPGMRFAVYRRGGDD